MGIGAIVLTLAASFTLNGAPIHVSAAATTSIWLQTMDSCKQAWGGGSYQIVNSSDTVNEVVKTPASSLTTVSKSGTCPLQRGNCSTMTDGCVEFTGLTYPDTYQIHMTVTPPKNGGSPLGYSACAGGSACRSEIVNITIDASGAVSATSTSTYPDGFVAVFPSGGTYAGTKADPVVFHLFGLGSGNCDGDSDADDQLTGSPGSHCGYPEADEASACQPYPWSCTLAVIQPCSFSCTAGPATHFVLSNPGTATAGTPVLETITAEDGHNLTARTYTGNQSLTWSGPSKSPNGTLTRYPANPVNFTSGVAKVNITFTDAQTASLSVTQGSLSGTMNGLTVVAGPPSAFKLAATTSEVAGTAFKTTVTALDTYGNAATYSGAKTLAWSGPSNAPNGTAPSYPANPVTFAKGAATVTVTLFDEQTTALSVADGTTKGSLAGVSVTAPSANHFSVATPAPPTAGVAFNETVTAVDLYGNPYTGYTGSKTLSWAGPSNSPNNTAPVFPTSVTFTSGAASVPVKLYDAAATTMTVTQGGMSGTSGTFTVNPAPASSFALSPPGPQSAGTQFNEGVTALDPYQNIATGYSGTKSLQWSGPSKSPNGAKPTYPSSVTFAGGVGTASITLVDVQSTALTALQSTITGTTSPFNVANGTVGQLLPGNPGSPTAGSPFTETITATDSFGNPFNGTQCVTFSGPTESPNQTQPSYPAQGSCAAGQSSVTFTNGTGTASITLVNAANTSLTVSNGTLNGTSTAFTVKPASASQFSVLTPTIQTAGAQFSEKITALDMFGNTATTYAGVPTISGPHSAPNPNPAYAPSYSTASFSGGVATVNITLFDAETTALTVSDGTVIGASGSFTVRPAGANAFSVSSPATSPTAGSSFTETVTAFDTYGNLATGYSGNQALTWSGPSNSPNATVPAYPATVLFTYGVGTASVTLYDAQTTTLTAVQGALSGTTTTSFTVQFGPAAQLSPGTPATAPIAGASFNEPVTAADAYGNAFTGSLCVTFAGPANSPTGTPPIYPVPGTSCAKGQSIISFASGAGSASITLFDAQSTSLSVTAGTFNGTSAGFSVIAAAPYQFVVPAPAAQISAGSPFTETITAIDLYGNTATSYSGTTTLTWSGPSNSPAPTNATPVYPSSVSFVAGVGSGSITLVDAQSTLMSVTDGVISGTSPGFTVTPGAVSAFSLSYPGPQSAGVAFNEIVTAVDSYQNTVTAYSGSQALVWSGPSNAPSASPTYPPNVNFSTGIGTASITLVDAQSTTLTATQGAITGSTPSFTVAAGPVGQLLPATPASQIAGAPFSESIAATDGFGNPYTGSQCLTFSGPLNSPNSTAPVYPAQGSCAAGQSFVTFSNGTGSASITLFNAATTILSVSNGTLNGASSGFIVSADSPNDLTAPGTFTLTTPSSPQTAGVSFTETITALDHWGNLATGYNGAPTFQSGATNPHNSPGAVAPSYSAVSFSGGQATVSVTLFDAESNIQLTLSDGTVSGSSGLFSVNPANASVLTLTPLRTQTAGVAFSETVTAVDAYGNTALSYAGSQPLTWSGPANAPNNTAPLYPSSVSFTAGVGVASITFYDAQTTTLGVSDGTNSGTTGPFTVSPGNPDSATNPGSLALAAIPGTQTAGAAFPVTVTAYDAWSNVATNYAGALTISGPHAAPFGATPTYSGLSFTNGVANVTATLFAAETTTLGVSDGTISVTSNSITVNAASPDDSSNPGSFSLATPGNQTAGVQFTEAVSVFDHWGNPATTYSGSPTFQSGSNNPHSSPNTTAPSYGPVSFTNGAASVNITLFAAESNLVLSLSDGTASGTSTPGTFSVSPGSTSQLVATLPPNSSVGSPGTANVAAEDQWGNVVTGDNSTLSVTSSDPLANANPANSLQPTYPTSITLSNGTTTFQITFLTPGMQTVTVSGDGPPTLTGTSNQTTVT